MKNEFNLEKFLVENRLTTNSRMMKEEQIESLGIELGTDKEVGMILNPKNPGTEENIYIRPAQIMGASIDDGGKYKEAYIYIQGQEELISKLHGLYKSQRWEELYAELEKITSDRGGMSLRQFVAGRDNSRKSELSEEEGTNLRLGREYEVHEPGMDEWLAGFEYLGYDRNEGEHIFRDSVNLAPGSNEAIFFRVPNEDIESTVR